MQIPNIRSNVPVDIIRVFLISDFPAESLKANKKLAEKITHFTKQPFSKSLTHFTSLNSLDAENNILSQHSQNSL